MMLWTFCREVWTLRMLKVWLCSSMEWAPFPISASVTIPIPLFFRLDLLHQVRPSSLPLHLRSLQLPPVVRCPSVLKMWSCWNQLTCNRPTPSYRLSSWNRARNSSVSKSRIHTGAPFPMPLLSLQINPLENLNVSRLRTYRRTNLWSTPPIVFTTFL